MKKYIYLAFSALAVLFTSCIDDSTSVDAISNSPNLAGFINTSASVSAVAGTEETEFPKELTVGIIGPSTDAVSGTVTATVAVNTDLTTAVEGTHYRLDNTTFEIGPDDNNFGTFTFTMLTDGIEPPLAANPVLALDVVSVSGDKNVIARGSTIIVNMLYLCFADLTGTYSVTNDFCATTHTTTIVQNPDGSWYSTVSADGGFLHTCTSNVTLNNYGSFNEVCGVIQPSSDLRYGSLGIGTILGGTWDQDAGIIEMDHSDVFFNGGPYNWSSTWTRQ